MIRVGDCLAGLREMDDESVNCCVTSPPYFGLRDYGHDGQIGLEPSPEEYVAKLVEVFREVRRVLRDDGTLWLNLGDSYANDGKWGGSSGGKHVTALHGDTGIGRGKVTTGLKPKNLIGIPWRVAFALQADGWYLRQDIIWSKPNPMPESVKDRCTQSHEYLFLLSKSPRYFFNAEAIKEPAAQSSVERLLQDVANQAGSLRANGGSDRPFKAGGRSARDSFKRDGSKRVEAIPGQSVGTHRPERAESDHDIHSRNKRSVWSVATKPFAEAHFATFPEELIEPCLLAGCPVDGVVLDPFLGAGTTAVVAAKLGLAWEGLELNPEYAAIAEDRIRGAQPGLAIPATVDVGSNQCA